MNNSTLTTDQTEVFVPESEQSAWFEKLQSIISFSEMLRLFGACAVLASMSLFLMNGWAEGNDIQRYLKLLTQTGLLTGAGIMLSVGLKEFKGARIFFGLSLVSVAANFTILGALLYSMVQWDNALQEYPAALTWQAVEFSSFLPLFAGAAALLTVLSRFSFGIFARKHASLLCTTFLIMCAALLIPVRDSLAISLLVLGAGLLAFKVVQKVRNSDGFVNTPEANFALATLFIAPSIMLVRALSLYNVDEVLAITLSALALFALRAVSLREANRLAVHLSGLQRLLGIAQFLLALNISTQLSSIVGQSSGDLIGLGTFLASFLGFTAEFVFSQRRQRARSQYLLWGVIVLLVASLTGALFGSAFGSGISYTVIALITSVTCFVLSRYCVSLNTRAALALSSVAIVLSGAMLALELIDTLNLSNWVLVGVTGGVLIVGASLYERFGLRLSTGT